MKNVTVFVPIQLSVKGDNLLEEVQQELMLINRVINISELDSTPHLNTDLVGDAEIVIDEQE